MLVSLILKERDECCSSGFTSPNEWFIDPCWKQSALLTTGSRVQMGAVFPFLCEPNGIDCLRNSTFSLGSFYFSDFCHSQCLWKEEINGPCKIVQRRTGKASQGFGLILTFLHYILGLLHGSKGWVLVSLRAWLWGSCAPSMSPPLLLSVLEVGKVFRGQKYMNFLLIGTVQTGMFGLLTWVMPEGIPRQCCPSLLWSLPSLQCLKLQGWDQRVPLLPARVERLPGSCPVPHGALDCLKGQETLKLQRKQGLARVCLWAV